MLIGHVPDESPAVVHSSGSGAVTRGIPAQLAVPTGTPGEPELDSMRLLQGRREILIRHGGECYRLRHTRNDKLILTK